MAGLAPSTLISQIRHPHSAQQQISALKVLRNDIIGNQQRKDVWMASGVIEAVVEAATLRAPNDIDEEQHIEDAFTPPLSLKSSENVRLEALAVLGSFASGGLEFVGAIYAASALPAILANLCPVNNPSLLVLAALRALSALARSSLLSIEPHPPNLLVLADALFSDRQLSSLLGILHQSSKGVEVDTQISYTASLISILCCHDRHRDSLASAGVVEGLADILAAVVVSQGLAIPRPGLHSHVEELMRESSIAHPEKVDIGGILQALAVIVGDSKSRAYSLVCSPSLHGILQHGSSMPTWANSSHEPTRSHNVIDYLNPQAPCSKYYMASAVSSAFPPLGCHDLLDSDSFSAHSRATSSLNKRSDYANISSECSTPKSAHETESPIISYLIWMTRSSQVTLGLMSAYLLVVLYKVGMAAQHRETEIALLVVPLLVLWLDESAYDLPPSCERMRAQSWVLETLAPVVLAKLVLDSERLQKAAYDAGAIPRLCKVLRASYQPITSALDGRSWSPHDAKSRKGARSPSTTEYVFPPLLVHKIKIREGVLRAIAALIPFKEEYRKALIDQGVMGIIVESLKPKPGEQQEERADGINGNKGTAGPAVCNTELSLGINPVPVLAAACATLRHLSRSPSILRTTLVDSGVVMPIFELLHYPDVEVQIAATAAVCNIVTEMSPMRQTISEAGVLKVLCQHAHSKNVNMRYNALWALKHFVQAAGNETKKSCLRELGQEWLIRLICGDMEDETCSSTNAAKTILDRDFDVAMASAADGDDAQFSSYAHLELISGDKDVGAAPLSRRASAQLPDSTSSSIKILDDAKQARKDDTRVQEQGLEFLRNLIAGYNIAGNGDNTDMITYLFNAFGEDNLFELLTSKLRSKVHHPFLRGHSGVNDGETRVSPPRPEILTAVGWILVNIAASVPCHRQAVIRQTELLRLLLQHAGHPVKDVRLAFCWLIQNLTWVDNDQDSIAQVGRVRELEKLGYLAKLDLLVKDEDLDVRERAKTARVQLVQRHGS